VADVGVRDGVQVNAINPGAVRTARLTARLQTLSREAGISEAEAEARMVADSGITKLGEPADVANLVACMVSPQNRYLRGALVDLDGGTTKTI
jgi:3-oxoacyl-[acyl-carrier protein] reductase